MKGIKNRLERLQGKRRPAAACVVVYDPATGEPVTKVPTGAKVLVMLPDNDRGDVTLPEPTEQPQ